MSLWEDCEGRQYIKTIRAEPWRVVEAQHLLSSRDLVDTREEHDLLEELLEESKPDIKKDKHYLIFTPFRYPPLKYGSRFSHVFEPSLWYGSLELETAFAEVAYYRLQFLNSTAGDLGYIEIPMTAFKACLHTKKGIDLTLKPFMDYQENISNKKTYEVSQPLGAAMRQEGIEAFIFYSARTKASAKNIAAYTPDVFQKKNNHYVNNQQTWVCLASKHVIEFTRLDVFGKECLSFPEHFFW
ncbi:RES family NAD+ phosphorylase [Legionella nagasakiensis]|uniref:RES family NAD+ phosphorylase n=1 Tax=Legionella nagasakiensis TaxID=535290 RepID=UPI0010546A5C|nr:RES family NAD+ phosphorylase [Legionella nagasakiensis]